MDIRKRLMIFSIAAACVFSIAIPLVSLASKNVAPTPLPDITDSVPDTTEEYISDLPVTEPPSFDSASELVVYIKKDEKNETMSLEDYIVCVVAAEMPYTFNTEALKAQAVAARSYCMYKMLSGNSHENGADVCTDYAHCAAYTSYSELLKRYGEDTADSILKKIKNAVKETEGQVITYNGRVALAVFHSRSYKYTESSKNIWGGKVPYLVSVPTPESDSISTVTLTNAQLSELFSSKSAVKLNQTEVQTGLYSYFTDSGRHDYVCLGEYAVKAKLLRSEFGFRSLSFEYEQVDGGWLFTIHGYGHGVGMSQYGANEMAKNGATYDEILKHYYTGVKIENIDEGKT